MKTGEGAMKAFSFFSRRTASEEAAILESCARVRPITRPDGDLGMASLSELEIALW